MKGTLRTIKRQPQYERDLEKIFGTAERADEAIRGLEWYIARQPERGFAVPKMDPNRFASWVSHSTTCSVQVVYEFNQQEVICISARLVPPRTNSFF